MRLFVGVTDRQWFHYLRQIEPDEVNFWKPVGERKFGALKPGGLFLFKLHSPDNLIVGGGYFSGFWQLPLTLAWEAFREKNGAPSLTRMRVSIDQYRASYGDRFQNYTIGCIILGAPFFFHDHDWIQCPDWLMASLRGPGVGYEVASQEGQWLSAEVEARFPRSASRAPAVANPLPLGEGAFRVLVTEAYERRCAITRQPVLPALDVALIKPASMGGPRRVDNGLLFRSDIRRLFDSGYVTVSPDGMFRTSRRIRDEFNNGEEYAQLNGSSLWVPHAEAERPRREFLEWHADTVFRA